MCCPSRIAHWRTIFAFVVDNDLNTNEKNTFILIFATNTNRLGFHFISWEFVCYILLLAKKQMYLYICGVYHICICSNKKIIRNLLFMVIACCLLVQAVVSSSSLIQSFLYNLPFDDVVLDMKHLFVEETKITSHV